MLLDNVNPLATREIPKSEKTPDDILVEIGSPHPWIDAYKRYCPATLLGRSVSGMDNYNSGYVSPEVLGKVKRYLHENELQDVCVSVNQYRPKLVWKRTFSNPRTNLLSKICFGIPAILEYTLLPGRLLGSGDAYSPLNNTIHLYSDDSAAALHECGHAKDYQTRKNPNSYLLLGPIIDQIIPKGNSLVQLWREYLASSHAMNFIRRSSPLEAGESVRKMTGGFAGYCALFISDAFSSASKMVSTALMLYVIGCGTFLMRSDQVLSTEECSTHQKTMMEYFWVTGICYASMALVARFAGSLLARRESPT